MFLKRFYHIIVFQSLFFSILIKKIECNTVGPKSLCSYFTKGFTLVFFNMILKRNITIFGVRIYVSNRTVICMFSTNHVDTFQIYKYTECISPNSSKYFACFLSFFKNENLMVKETTFNQRLNEVEVFNSK